MSDDRKICYWAMVNDEEELCDTTIQAALERYIGHMRVDGRPVPDTVTVYG